MAGKLRPTEKQVAAQIIDWLRLLGWQVHRLEADVYGAKARVYLEDAGTPDLIAIRQRGGPGSACDVAYIEVKRPGGRLRRSQQIWIDDARKRGWTVIVASGIEDLRGLPGCDDRPVAEWIADLRHLCAPPAGGRQNPIELLRGLREE